MLLLLQLVEGLVVVEVEGLLDKVMLAELHEGRTTTHEQYSEATEVLVEQGWEMMASMAGAWQWLATRR